MHTHRIVRFQTCDCENLSVEILLTTQKRGNEENQSRRNYKSFKTIPTFATMVSILTICSVTFRWILFLLAISKKMFYTGSRFSNFNDYISPFVYLGTSIHTKINNKTFFIPNPIKFTVLHFRFLYFYLSIDTTDLVTFTEEILNGTSFFVQCDLLFIHGPIIRTGTICKKIPCYLRYSACRWRIVENAKIFSSYVKHF